MSRDPLFCGLSPRLRGNLGLASHNCPDMGSIPAPAGEPVLWANLRDNITVYPRACGGTRTRCRSPATGRGLSPRLRGNRSPPPPAASPRRSIPAPAGEPPRWMSGVRLYPVYPRACGGTELAIRWGLTVPGLSPRLRGNLCRCQSQVSPWGSIPAPAGEPRRNEWAMTWDRVYPRACGGNRR